MHNRIREETDNKIVLGTENIRWAFSLLDSLSSWKTDSDNIFSKLLAILGFILFLIVFILIPIFLLFLLLLLILYGLLVIETVTIDKKSQNIIIQTNIISKSLKFIKEIPFSDMDRIQIKTKMTGGSGDESNSRRINIITNQGRSIKIYNTYDGSDAIGLAEKISKITGKEISYS